VEAVIVIEAIGGRVDYDEGYFKLPKRFTAVVGVDLWRPKDAELIQIQPYLQGLPSLKVVRLQFGDATRVGVNKLQKALPGCEILWDDGEPDQSRAGSRLR
jgi:hypothetical protein